MRVRRLLPLALTLILLIMVSLVPLTQRVALSRTPSILATPSAGQLPISFEANQGQADSQVRFLAHGPGYTLFLTPQESLLALSISKYSPSASSDSFSPGGADISTLTSANAPMLVGMQFLNANPQPEVTGEYPLPGIVNYLLGNNPATWHTNIPTFAQVRYHTIYPGIDLLYHSNQGHPEYDFIVAPGSNPSQIHLNFTGIERLSLGAQGELLLHLPVGDLPEGAPQVYQVIKGMRQQIASRYVMQGATEVGFALGAYDTSKPLVIDPMVLFSTYLGGLNNDYNTGLAIDNQGNTYITGATSSTNFPSKNPLQTAPGGGPSDAFITKVNAAGSALVYSTYLGGNDADWGNSIAVDSTGNAYITGGTSSTNFPTQSALQSANAGGSDAFVAEVNAAGTSLVYSTYLGGNGADWGNSIAVDSAGNAYIAGVTSSTNFPTQNALQPTFGGGSSDAFIAKVHAAGSALVYSTYLGGNGADWGTGIAVDGAGNAYITGGTSSTNFPTQSAVQSANAGTANAFVAKVNAAGSALVYSTYLGGSNYDYARGIALDGAGDAYVTGITHSSNFPTVNPLQSAIASNTDAFVTKLNTTGTALVYSTYLGGNGTDEGTGIVVDSAGNAYITGNTNSSSFPTHNPSQFANAGGVDAFVAEVMATGNALLYSSYLGGSGDDRGTGIAIGSTSNVYVTGATTSSNFPASHPIQARAGMEDGFLVKLDMAIPSFNNEGISSDGVPTSSSFDGSISSYSNTALQAAGFVPGTTVTVNGMSFQWPTVAAGTNDNWQAAGQVIPITAPGAAFVGFLGASTYGPASGTGVLTYTDGSTQSFTLTWSDWTLDGNQVALDPHDSIAAQMGYRNLSSGGRTTASTYLFFTSVPLAAGKTLQSVTLPTAASQGALHVFAIGTETAAQAAQRNNEGISSDGVPTSSSFDGSISSYSNTALQAAGFVPGTTVTVNGMSFQWPSVAAGTNDNWRAAGQVIPITAPGAAFVGFLGASTYGPASGTGMLTYTDGSTQSFTLTWSDWTLDGGQATVDPHDTVAAQMSYRNLSSGGRTTASTYLFFTSVPLAAGKTLQSVTLPTAASQGALHVFAIGTETAAQAAQRNNEGISSDGVPTSSSFDGSISSYSNTALQAAGFVPGTTVTVNGMSFQWPTVAAGTNDNWQAAGQVIPITAPGAAFVGFLGASTYGPASGTGVLTYTDGSTQSFTLTWSDWTLDGNQVALDPHDSIAAQMSYRNLSSGGRTTASTYLFFTSVPLAAGKTLQSVTLPTAASQGALHVFAIGTSTTAPTTGFAGERATAPMAVPPGPASTKAAIPMAIPVKKEREKQVFFSYCASLPDRFEDLLIRWSQQRQHLLIA